MNYKQTTHVPNSLFDIHLTGLNFSELKLLLIIIRQTWGWMNPKTKKRKKRDRITYGQFMEKTKLSRRIVSESVQSLIKKGLIQVTDYHQNILHSPELRKGKVSIYYAPLVSSSAEKNTNLCRKRQEPVQNKVYNKTNLTKLKRQKEIGKKRIIKKVSDWERIQTLLAQR